MEKLWQKLSSLAFNRPQSHEQSETGPASDRNAPLIPQSTSTWLADILGFSPIEEKLYVIALTHRSIVHDHPESSDSNQRLEFLGDAVLDLIISELLYTVFPESDEGKLSSNRAKIVNRKSLAGFAEKISLGEHLLIGETADKINIQTSTSSLADAFEALIGALYLDKGLEETRKFIMRHVAGHVDIMKIDTVENNYKSRLIEYTQCHQIAPPVYTVVSEEGAEHEKLFTIEVSCDNRPLGIGSARRKKDAEQTAAREALDELDAITHSESD